MLTPAPLDSSGRAPASAVVELACRAPSVENSQPWRWRATGTRIELYADRGRQLDETDPEGRNLMMSCGSALHHAQVAARGLGWEPHVVRRPDPGERDLLARIELERTRTDATSRTELEALLQRCTDRRRFTSWPVDLERLDRLGEVARAWGGDAEAVTDVGTGLRVERLVSRAQQVQAVRVDPGRRLPLGLAQPHVSTDRDVVSTDRLLVLVGATDDDAAWLATGEALGAIWIEATLDAMSILPLSQVVDVPETRTGLQYDVLAGGGLPHLLLRVGWQQIGRQPWGRTPRRALADVLIGADVLIDVPVGDQGPTAAGPAPVGGPLRRP